MLKDSLKLFKIAFKHDPSNKFNLILTIALELTSIGFLFWLNAIYGNLYQAIQDYNLKGIWWSITEFCIGAGALVFINGYAGFMTSRLAFSIRNGLTSYYVSIQHLLKATENRDQRIQEDLRNFGLHSVEFWVAIFTALIKLPLFLGVVVSLTHWYTGLIVFLAVILGTVITKLVSNKLIALQAEQENNEAAFRKSVVVDGLQWFVPIREQFKKINERIKLLSFTQSGFSQGFVLLPFILLMPLYIAKTITLGSLMQSSSALGKVIDSLTVIITNRTLMVNLESTLLRLKALDQLR